MEVREIPVADIELSDYNVRKNLADGQHDSTIANLATSIAKQGLLSPITVFRKDGGRFGLIAGQRRLPCRKLGWSTIPAIVRETVSDADATAISLVENVHRADMNPNDKARAFKALLDRLGDVPAVSRETGVGVGPSRSTSTSLPWRLNSGIVSRRGMPKIQRRWPSLPSAFRTSRSSSKCGTGSLASLKTCS